MVVRLVAARTQQQPQSKQKNTLKKLKVQLDELSLAPMFWDKRGRSEGRTESERAAVAARRRSTTVVGPVCASVER